MLLAFTAHVGAGGVAPGPGVLAVSVLAATTACRPFTGRRLSPAVTLMLLGGLQIALHTAFVAVSGPGATDRFGEAACGHPYLIELGVMPHGMPMHMGPLMLLAHTLATVALALVLTHGETLLWSLAACLAAHLPAQRTIDLSAWVPPVPRAITTFGLRTGDDPVPSRRGPPAPIAA